MKEFLTLAAGVHERRSVIEGSEFLAFGKRVRSHEEFLSWLNEIKAVHPDATHHCWAWLIDGNVRFNDDGEPGGTAGAPMARALQGAGVEQVGAVVVRYFGGKKLGAGGLVRAYGGAVTALLAEASLERVVPRLGLRLGVGWNEQDALFRLVGRWELTHNEAEYGANGPLLTVAVTEAQLGDFLQEFTEQTRGQGEAEELDWLPEGWPS